jgi:hypothetical protein
MGYPLNTMPGERVDSHQLWSRLLRCQCVRVQNVRYGTRM